jgi:hypothetical protein
MEKFRYFQTDPDHLQVQEWAAGTGSGSGSIRQQCTLNLRKTFNTVVSYEPADCFFCFYF